MASSPPQGWRLVPPLFFFFGLIFLRRFIAHRKPDGEDYKYHKHCEQGKDIR
jgi:hypothetical protein